MFAYTTSTGIETIHNYVRCSPKDLKVGAEAGEDG
jgi:hypothetical protein